MNHQKNRNGPPDFQTKDWQLTAKIVVAILIAITLPACSSFNETRFENSLGRDVNLIRYAHNIADDLIVSSFPPLVPRHPDMPVLTTTFVDNNQLEKTSHFGRLIQDHIGTRFVQAGFTVKELKLREELEIHQRSGEIMLSRNLELLKPHQRAQAVLLGTISMSQRTMYISARLVDPKDARILAAQNYRLYMDKNVLAMFDLSTGGNRQEAIRPPSEPLMNSILF
jgi:TolB-like protein